MSCNFVHITFWIGTLHSIFECAEVVLLLISVMVVIFLLYILNGQFAVYFVFIQRFLPLFYHFVIYLLLPDIYSFIKLCVICNIYVFVTFEETICIYCREVWFVVDSYYTNIYTYMVSLFSTCCIFDIWSVLRTVGFVQT